MTGSGLENFNDFEKPDVTDPDVIAGWLTATWDPLQNILNNKNSPNIVQSTYAAYPVIKKAYPAETDWVTFADAFSNNPTPYIEVHSLLAAADQDRSKVNVFLNSVAKSNTNTQVQLTGDAVAIAETLEQGLTPKVQPVVSWLHGFLNFLGKAIQVFCTSMGTFTGALIGSGAGPGPGTVVGGFVGSLIGGMIGAGIASLFSDVLGPLTDEKPPALPKNPVNLAADAFSIETDMKKKFDQAFNALTAPKFLTSTFSNYGLLEAMGRIQFSSSAGGAVTPTNVVKQAYDTSVWDKLLPEMFKWKLVPYESSASSLPNFTAFSPLSEDAHWERPDRYYWDGYGNDPGDKNLAQVFTLKGGVDEMNAEAESEVVSLQNGTKFNFEGHDFTPADWWGPGPISGPQDLQGNPARFYAITTNAHLKQQPLWRRSGYWYKTNSEVTGDTIQEYELVTRDGNQEISPAVAAALFGSIPTGGLDPNSPLTDYDGGQYVDFPLSPGGLATRFEVFSQFGKGVEGFSPYTLRPDKSNGSMEVNKDPYNEESGYFGKTYADYTLTYG